MQHHHLADQRVSRRNLLQSAGCGFGYLAMAGIAHSQAIANGANQGPLSPKEPHFAAKAKRVIFLFMQGGPSHIDMLDYKPELAAIAEKEKGGRGGALLPSPWKFAPHGESGLPISELLPNLARHADDLCLLNGMHTDNPAHPQATIMWHTGSINFVRPSIGSWVVYGLGSENQNLPGFVTINPPDNLGGAQNYGSAFLPASYQGTRINVAKEPIANIQNRILDSDRQRRQLDFVQSLNRDFREKTQHDTEVEGIIQSYELAFRMQATVPDLMDIAQESQATKERYGIEERTTRNFGTQCLMARRMAEAGVRFIQVNHRGWDQHNNLKVKLAENCQAIDQPIAALLEDLKQRDMLKDTLLVWSGEFGRTANEQNNFDGRRHNNRGYSAWLAGGGVKGGLRFGATDPTGNEAVEGKVHTHDLHATILHLMGLDHERLTYRYSGRDFRLTDVYGRVVSEIIA